jgi:hypothetical protein
VGVGRLAGGRLVAHLVPFAGGSVAWQDMVDLLKERPDQMEMVVSGDRIRVTRSDVDRFCGLGSDLMGRYVRSRKTLERYDREIDAKQAGKALSAKELDNLVASRRHDLQGAWTAASQPENASGSCAAKIGERPALALANLCKLNGGRAECRPDASCTSLRAGAHTFCLLWEKKEPTAPGAVPCLDHLPLEMWDIYAPLRPTN